LVQSAPRVLLDGVRLSVTTTYLIRVMYTVAVLSLSFVQSRTAI